MTSFWGLRRALHPEAPLVTVLELVGDEYREVAAADGAEPLRVDRPFPLTLVPEDLVAL